MSIKLTADSYLRGIRQSGLVEDDELDSLVERFRGDGIDVEDADALNTALIDAGAITDWQAGKLSQGKHKGFMLGRYRLLSLLGRGEMSAVYLGEHNRMRRRCAIKVLPAHRVRNTSYLGRFHREAQAVAALDHPNIVRAYDVDQVEEGGVEIHFLVMEYVEGRDLDSLVRDRERLEVLEAVDLVRQAAEGLAHAHAAGLVHRDIKPGNFLIDDAGRVRMLDLGLARFFKETEVESLTIKHDEKVLGTADFLAPEQAVDSHEVDTRADVYSLGCTLYFALAGRPPFTDDTLVQRLLAHQTREPTPITELRDDVPSSLVGILARMMAKSPDDRYQTADELAADLAKWLVEHAGEDWKRRNIALVADVVGFDNLFSPQGDTARPDVPPAKAAPPKSAEKAVPVEKRNARTRPAEPSDATGERERPRKRAPGGRSERRAPRSSSTRVAVAEAPAVEVEVEEVSDAPTAGRRLGSLADWPIWQLVCAIVMVVAVTVLGVHQIVTWFGEPTSQTAAIDEE